MRRGAERTANTLTAVHCPSLLQLLVAAAAAAAHMLEPHPGNLNRKLEKVDAVTDITLACPQRHCRCRSPRRSVSSGSGVDAAAVTAGVHVCIYTEFPPQPTRRMFPMLR